MPVTDWQRSWLAWWAGPGWQVLTVVFTTLALMALASWLIRRLWPNLFPAPGSTLAEASSEAGATDEGNDKGATARLLASSLRALILAVIAAAGLFWTLHLLRIDVWPLILEPVLTWLVGSGLRLVLMTLGAWLVVRLAHGVIDRSANLWLKAKVEAEEERNRRLATLRSILHNAITVTIVVVTVIMALRELNFDITPLVTAAGVGGLAVGLAAQNLIRDYLGGFFLLVEDQLRVGDVVQIGSASGVVEQINLRTVILRSLDGTVHTIPNGQITTVSNMSKTYSRYVLDVEVAYKEDVDFVMATLKELGEELAADPDWGPLVLAPAEVLGVDSLGASGVQIRVLLSTQPLRQWEVGREFRRRIKNRFDHLGIEIPFPHTTLYWGSTSDPLQVAFQQESYQDPKVEGTNPRRVGSPPGVGQSSE